MNDLPRLAYTTKEAATVARVSENTIRKWVKLGLIRTVSMPMTDTRRVLIPVATFGDDIAALTTERDAG